MNILIDVAIQEDRNAMKKEAEKKLKCMALCVEITPNLEHEMYDHTGVNWSHRNRNKRFKFGSRTRKTFIRLSTKGSCTSNITHNAGSTKKN